ncbi:MAG: UvrD-helicase domain-containing protein, partial [Anaerovoracaceae bacterium]
MKWTKEQQEAIELRNKNILVSAAAGSGKTAVLVERIKRLIIEEKCPVDRML